MATDDAVTRILDALRDHGSLIRDNGSGSMAQCPAHDDGNPSLSLGRRNDDRGAVLKCFAGCSHIDVLAALNLTESDLYDDPKISKTLYPKQTYNYSGGRIKKRWVQSNGKKAFSQKNADDDSLYGADKIANAKVVYLCEGEKAVDFLATIGQAAVATGGAEFTCDLTPLKDKVVLIVADRDEKGHNWAQKHAKLLQGITAAVSIVQAKPQIAKADIVEHISAGYTLEDLEHVPIAETNGHQPPEVIEPEPVTPIDCRDEAHLLDMVHEFIGRFVNYPDEHCHTAHTLWIAHTWFMDLWESTPRIAFMSPEPASGKSRALEVTEALVPNPIHSVNVTPAYLFRKVADPDGLPTILYDEIDTVFGPKAKDNEEIRGLLNSGHRRGAVAGRCVVKGKKIETEEIPSYCAVALAGLHTLPDTILTRSVVVRMRRRAPGDHIEPWRMGINGLQAAPLRAALAEWSVAGRGSNVAGVAGRTQLPEGIEDRNADVWEALVAVGDMAGGQWPAKARVAAVAGVAAFREETPSLGVQLLWDIYKVFCDSGHGALPANVAAVSADLVSNLKGIEEAPWATYGRDRKGLDTLRLSKLLSNYGIKSRNTRLGDTVAKAYHVWQFEDAWERYGTGPSSPKPATPATPATQMVVSTNENFWR